MASDRYNAISEKLRAQNSATTQQRKVSAAPTVTSGRLEKIKEKLRSGGFTPSFKAEDVDAFLRDSLSFAEQSDKEYSGLTWAQATSSEYQAKRKSANADLASRATKVRTYLNANKSSIDPETYENHMSYLDDFSNYQAQSAANFEKHATVRKYVLKPFLHQSAPPMSEPNELIGVVSR